MGHPIDLYMIYLDLFRFILAECDKCISRVVDLNSRSLFMILLIYHRNVFHFRWRYNEFL
jgi:hypothetical protein